MDKPPNIVFIFADDLGYGDMGCYGATKIQTPNVDKIASQGIKFEDAHSSSAVCTPSRYSVITGRYCWRTELKKWVMWGYNPPLVEKERMTIASLLKKHGYATAAIGKWHLGLGWHYIKDGMSDGGKYADVDFEKPITGGPNELGFDYFFGIAGSLDMNPYCFIENDHTVGIPSVPKNPKYNQQRMGLMVPDWKDEEVDTTFAQKAIDFIEKNQKESPDKPFFLYLPTASPHRPCDCQPDFVKNKSQAGDRGDMVVLFDWVVGQIEKTLQKYDLVDNTLFIITSDNGARLLCANGQDYGHKSCGNLRGQKADIWDGGHREPFIARWPNHIKPGTDSKETICLVDLLSTFAAIVDEKLPNDAGEDSFNILPAMLGKDIKQPIRESIIHHSGGGMFAIRKGNWKMIQGLGSGGFSRPQWMKKFFWRPAGQLYDMESDILESENLYKKRPKIVKELTELLEKYIKNDYSRPLDN
jgi:arylsulfatase A